MSFALKIVGGPNKGAEVALVEGVAVTIGKGDECDIVLADTSLPDAPAKIETMASGVSVDGETLEPLHVKTIGDTSFAVGPASGPWGELVWPSSEAPSASPAPEGERPQSATPAPAAPAEAKSAKEGGKSHGCLVWIVVVVLLAAALSWVAYRYRPLIMSRAESYRPHAVAAWKWCAGKCKTVYVRYAKRGEAVAEAAPRRNAAEAVAEIAKANGFDVAEEDGSLVISGNLGTRAERLAVTAEIYEAMPCVDLRLSDDETLKTAVEDTLSLIGETGMCVRAVTNRVAVLDGTSPDPATLVSRIAQEVPKIRAIDGNSIRLCMADAVAPATNAAPRAASMPVRKVVPPKLPVCGILTSPYPCLVTRKGARIMEGASIGDWTVLKIEADSVVLGGAAGRFVWKP